MSAPAVRPVQSLTLSRQNLHHFLLLQKPPVNYLLNKRCQHCHFVFLMVTETLSV